MWSSLLLLTFVRLNPKLKKLQFRTGTTYTGYALIVFVIGSISIWGVCITARVITLSS